MTMWFESFSKFCFENTPVTYFFHQVAPSFWQAVWNWFSIDVSSGSPASFSLMEYASFVRRVVAIR